MSNASPVLLQIEDGIALLTLNNPGRMNAVDQHMARALAVCVHTIATSQTVRVVILRAAGHAFCAGGDIALLATSAKGDCVEAERFFHVE